MDGSRSRRLRKRRQEKTSIKGAQGRVFWERESPGYVVVETRLAERLKAGARFNNYFDLLPYQNRDHHSATFLSLPPHGLDDVRMQNLPTSHPLPAQLTDSVYPFSSFLCLWACRYST